LAPTPTPWTIPGDDAASPGWCQSQERLVAMICSRVIYSANTLTMLGLSAGSDPKV